MVSYMALRVCGQSKPASSKPKLMAQLGPPNGFDDSFGFTADSKYLVTTNDVHALVWEVKSGREVFSYPLVSPFVGKTSFSKDGQYLVRTTSDAIELQDIRTGASFRRFPRHDSLGLRLFAADPVETDDGRYLLAGDAKLILWDLTKGTKISETEYSDHGADQIDISPNADRAITATSESVQMFDLKSGQRLWKTKATDGSMWRCSGVFFTADGTRVVTTFEWLQQSDAGPSIVVRDAKDGSLVTSFSDTAMRSVQTVRLSNRWDTLITVDKSPSEKDEVHIRDASTGATVMKFDGESFAMSANGDTLAVSHPKLTTLADGTLVFQRNNPIRIYHLPDRRLISELRGHNVPLWIARFADRNNHILLAGDSSTTWLWTANGLERRPTLLKHTDRIKTADISKDGRHILTVTSEGDSFIWEAPFTKLPVRLIRPKNSKILWAVLAPDGSVVGDADGQLLIWESTNGQPKGKLEATREALSPVLAFSPDGRFVVGGDKDYHIWRMENGKRIYTFEADGTAVGRHLTCAQFSPDMQSVAMQHGNEVWCLKLSNGHIAHKFGSQHGVIEAMAYSPDGKSLAVASADETVQIWDIAAEKKISELTGHRGNIHSIQFSYDGKWLITSSEDGTARLWNVNKVRETARIIHFDDGHWAVIDMEGHYDCDGDGVSPHLYLVVDGHCGDVAPKGATSYVPGLLSKLLGSDLPLR